METVLLKGINIVVK